MYSDNELKMFRALGIDPSLFCLEPSSLYRIILDHIFCNNLQGPEVESFRRCYNGAFRSSKIYRNTEEFDNLIVLDEQI